MDEKDILLRASAGQHDDGADSEHDPSRHRPGHTAQSRTLWLLTILSCAINILLLGLFVAFAQSRPTDRSQQVYCRPHKAGPAQEHD